jgi:hypothetical protein
LPLCENIDEGFAVESHRHRSPEIGVVKGRHSAVDYQFAGRVQRRQLAHRLRRLASDILQQRDGDLKGERHIELAGNEAGAARPAGSHRLWPQRTGLNIAIVF